MKGLIVTIYTDTSEFIMSIEEYFLWAETGFRIMNFKDE